MARQLVAVGLLAVLGGCGPTIPDGDGYSSSKEPWKKAKSVRWKDDNTAKIDDKVSYPDRKRARWYRLDIPADGELTVKMEVTPGEGMEDLKLGFEVMDAGWRTLVRKYEDEEFFPDKKGRIKKHKAKKAGGDDGDDDDDDSSGDDDDDDDSGGDGDADSDDDDDDDGGGTAADSGGDDLEWEQSLPDLRKGTYYIHVYTTRRLDAAEYTMKLTFKGGTINHESDFPAQVAFYEPLPVVPAIDDTPALDCKSCDCKTDGRCKLQCDRCDKKDTGGGHHNGHTTPPPKVDCETCDCGDAACKKTCKAKCGGGATCISARILRPTSAGGGTKLLVSAGSNQGVAVGWKGRVVDGKGKGIDGGDFTISNAGAGTSEGTAKASPDAVRQAGGVRLCPP